MIEALMLALSLAMKTTWVDNSISPNPKPSLTGYN